MTTRRTFLKGATLAFGVAATAGLDKLALASGPGALIDPVAAACRRLAPLGWRQLLLDATGGELDIAAGDLRRELAKPLAHIDRTHPGFGDFDVTAVRAIEPGNPDRSLLYHALAAPTVVADRAGTELGGFPTLAEIEAVENYVYGCSPPTLDALRRRAAGRPLGLAVFALQYRNAPESVHGRHAELCFARAGIARLGSIEPHYDARRRLFTAADEARPFDFRVVPRRFAAFLAVRMTGRWDSFGPQDIQPGDDKLDFWVPIHKLFSGPECIAGLDLRLTLERGLRNDLLAEFHRFLDLNGLENNWRGDDLEQFPFVIKDEMLGSLSSRQDYGDGVLEPRPSPLVTPAQYKGRPLTFPVDGRYMSDPQNNQLSSLQVLPALPPGEPAYLDDAAQQTQRPAPEYVNIRHRVLPNGQIENLNDRPDMDEIFRRGGYQALHYYDAAGDGWIAARCPEIEDGLDARLPAYCMVGLPDFFPKVNQRELMVWWQNEVPAPVRAALWALPPLALSQTRIAANVNLGVGFSLQDVTVAAIVSQPAEDPGPAQAPNGPVPGEKVGLPDGSPGLFDPGWETSQNVYYTDPEQPLRKFLTGHALGSPFIEDAKLCAALGAYWPGVAPDSTRTFPPDKRIGGVFYPYPTIVPLTDQEIGSAPLPDGRLLPWDGVHGPRLARHGDRPVVAYANAWRTDYIDLLGTMTAALTARIDAAEYKARILAMEAVYWSLGIHDPDFLARHGEPTATHKVIRAKADWAVLSFRSVAAGDADLAAAEREAGARLAGARRYGFHVFRWGKEIPDPDDLHTVFVEVIEQAFAYVAGNVVLLRHGEGRWTVDSSMPT
ncbi:MAG: hypothetical protein U1E53_16580 [Dongiaceae bacterium]